MNGKQKRKEHLLLFLLALLALSIAANFLPEHLNAPPARPPVRTEPPQQDATDDLPLLSRLGQQPAHFDQVHRNIFDFGSRVDGTPTLEEKAPAVPETMATETEPEESARSDISFIGYYHEKNPAGAVFASLLIGNKVYVGSTGDVIAQNYKLLQITPDHVVVRSVADTQDMTLPLGKSAPPAAAQKKSPATQNH